MNIKLFKCNNVFLCHVADCPNGEILVIKIEVFNNCKNRRKYLFNVTRLDSYRIKPTFPISKTNMPLADERIFVEDVFLWPNNREIVASSQEAAIKRVIRHIENKLGKNLQ